MQVDYARQQDRTDQDNDLVFFFLGAVNLLDDLATAVTEKARFPEDGALDGDIDSILAAMLGLLSLRRTLKRWACHAADDQTSSSPPAISIAPDAVTLR